MLSETLELGKEADELAEKPLFVAPARRPVVVDVDPSAVAGTPLVASAPNSNARAQQENHISGIIVTSAAEDSSSRNPSSVSVVYTPTSSSLTNTFTTNSPCTAQSPMTPSSTQQTTAIVASPSTAAAPPTERPQIPFPGVSSPFAALVAAVASASAQLPPHTTGPNHTINAHGHQITNAGSASTSVAAPASAPGPTATAAPPSPFARSPYSLGSPPLKRARSNSSTPLFSANPSNGPVSTASTSPVSTAVEWSSENVQNYYRLKKFLPTSIHPRLRLGASKNVGVGRVRLQSKGLGNSSAMATIKTFAIEEVDAIITQATAWAQTQPDCPQNLGSVGELLSSLARMPPQDFNPPPLLLHRAHTPQTPTNGSRSTKSQALAAATPTNGAETDPSAEHDHQHQQQHAQLNPHLNHTHSHNTQINPSLSTHPASTRNSTNVTPANGNLGTSGGNNPNAITGEGRSLLRYMAAATAHANAKGGAGQNGATGSGGVEGVQNGDMNGAGANAHNTQTLEELIDLRVQQFCERLGDFLKKELRAFV